MADLTLDQLLQDHARRAREVVGRIQHRDRPPDPPRTNAKTWTEDTIQRPPHDLDKIEEQLVSVADAIERYLNQHPGR